MKMHNGFSPAGAVVLAVCLCGGVTATAQTEPLSRAGRAAVAPTPGAEAAADPEPASRGPTVSDEVSSAISAGISYEPPRAEPDPEPDARDGDPPRNNILRLPRYIVESPRPPVFSERALYPREELAQFAYSRYFSPFQRDVLNRYRLPFVGQMDVAYALMLYEADERQRNMAETSGKIDLYQTTGDHEQAEQLEEDMENTFMRRTQILPALSFP